MADGELGNLRRAPRIIEHKIAKQSRFRTEGMAGGQFDAVIPVDVTDTISSLSDSASDGGGPVPEWFTESFTLTSAATATTTLTYIPLDYSEILTLNGIRLSETTDYTIADNVVTWTSLTDLILGIGSDSWKLTATYPYYDQAADDYASLIIGDGPLAYYRLDESSGTVMVDSSGNGRDGVYTAPPTLGVPGLLTGDTDTAASFNGSSQYAEVATAGAPWVSPATPSIEAIIKLSSTGSMAGILTHYYFSSGSYGLFVSAAAKAEMIVYIGGVGYAATGSTTLAAGTKYHVAGTYDGTTICVYVNGVLDGSYAVSGSADSHTGYAILVGRNDVFGSGGDYFPGVLDEVALYGSALTAGQIAAHAAAA